MFGRKIKLIRKENYTYFNDGGNCTYIEEYISRRKKKATQIIYSNDGKELTRIVDGSIVSIYRYDDKGNKIVNCEGNVDRFYTYDEKGNLLKRTSIFIGDNNIKSCRMEDIYKYDQNGNCIYQKEGHTETFRKFDSEGHEVHLRRISPYEEFECCKSYDEAGRITLYRDSNGELEQYRYNDKGQLVEKFETGEIQGECLYQYEYDQFGNLCHTSDSNGFSMWDTWISCNGCEFKLRSHADSTGLEITYKYDERGNLVHSYRKRVGSDEYWVHHRYDDCGHVIETIDSTGSTWTYEYNDHGDCRRLIEPNGKITIYRYCYDDEDRVVLKETLETRSKKYKH